MCEINEWCRQQQLAIGDSYNRSTDLDGVAYVFTVGVDHYTSVVDNRQEPQQLEGYIGFNNIRKRIFLA